MQKYFENCTCEYNKSRGFNVAVKKTKYVLFSRTSTDKINLNIDSQTIKQEEEAKFLGIIFDSKLTWKPRINFTHIRAAATCNMPKAFARTTWY